MDVACIRTRAHTRTHTGCLCDSAVHSKIQTPESWQAYETASEPSRRDVGTVKKNKTRPPFTRHQTRKDGQSDSSRFEVLTLFFRRWSPCFSSPGRSRILCFSWAWSLALLFHRKPASKPSSAGSESSMVPLLLSVLEPPLCLPALPVPTISSKGAPPPAPVRHFPPPRAPTQRPASAAEPRAALTTYSMYSAARDAAAPPNGSSVLLFGRLLPGSCVCVSVCVCVVRGRGCHRCKRTLHHFHLSSSTSLSTPGEIFTGTGGAGTIVSLLISVRSWKLES